MTAEFEHPVGPDCTCGGGGLVPHEPHCGTTPSTAFSHSPAEPCTCNGCWCCGGRVTGCTCDIERELAYEEAHRA